MTDACAPHVPADLLDDPGAVAVLGQLRVARAGVSAARVALVRADAVDWTSPSADGFRCALDHLARDLLAVLTALDDLTSRCVDLARARDQALAQVAADARTVAAARRAAGPLQPTGGAPR